VERLGLVGLPNSGKSSLFNALTGADTVVAPHPFSTTETAHALRQAPDQRVDLLGKMSS
jgi:ribosome-binding ATPase YchF (GTP1/OBG family)